MVNATRTNLKEIVELIQNQELLLPDFQRGFVWDLDMQQRLIASVLTKMPIGSILVLEADTDDFGCRILGRKDDVDLSGGKKNVNVLLDGQQRMTVLANVFSNLLFYDYSGSGRLMTDYKRLISVDLQNRFFLRIPAVEYLDEKRDRFHLKQLQFPMTSPESDIPEFLTEDIRDDIVYLSFDEKTEEVYAPHSAQPQNIGDFCLQDKFYYIPLFLLTNNHKGDSCNETRLKNILKDIVTRVVRYRLEMEFDTLKDESQKIHFVNQHIEEDYKKDIVKSGEVDRRTLENSWISMGETHWADKMKQYLTSCISNLDLHQIVVSKSNRNRAIDIYENLNIGGISLSTFELILAKAAKTKFQGNKNLFDLIVENIQQTKKYNAELVPDHMSKYYKKFLQSEGDYSASDQLGCFEEKKNQLNKKYTDIFLNVMSLISYVPSYDAGKAEVSFIKREKILSLMPDQIRKNYEITCNGIDRACFFLQVRCGIRKIQEVNYNLMLVLLGYVLANDTFYNDANVINLLETWYWCAIFSGRYDKDQTENIIEDINHVLYTIEKENADITWLTDMENKIFAMQGFSDADTLLMKTSVVPKNVIRKTICQFYLAKTYRDLMTDNDIQVFSDVADKLEEHHIVPIGVLNKESYKSVEKKRREDKKNIFNSPLNFVYISKESNLKISNHPIEFYIKHCNENATYELHIDIDGKVEIDESNLREILEKRFKIVKKDVENRINTYL